MSFFDRLKYKAWHHIYRFFLPMQRTLLKWGIIHHDSSRQKYHIGYLRQGKTLEELKKHLHESWGFGNHFIAWTDTDQVLSWRKLDDFQDQYHLRVYSDGEIRGHYEFTPEAHPLEHLEEKGKKGRKEEFLKFLGDFVVSEKYTSHLVMDPDAYNPDSEIMFEKN
ncbi:MAG: hypothetical protein AAB510_02625 [Patescibacteria group bacterium]